MFSPVFSGKLNTNEIYGKQSFSNCELDVRCRRFGGHDECGNINEPIGESYFY